jgi:hypothetical protein
MTQQWNEFTKSLAVPVPRRESLRRMGAVLAGMVLSPLGLGTAWAGGRDPCKSFCRCSNKAQQNQCLAACRACNGDTSRLCGSCGAYACCSTWATCCSGYCTDLASDFDNCGGCGNLCEAPGPYEDGACVDGACVYECVEGAADCGDGTCTYLGADPDNCGACGNVCAGSTPYCIQGACGDCPPGSAICGGVCTDVLFDGNNCGACGNQCAPLEHCSFGFCEGITPPGAPPLRYSR